jgi:hypothetical protein
MECKNCYAELDGRYCRNCGQKSDVQRVTFGFLFAELARILTEADKGIFLLIKELAYRPGLVAKEYLAGRRSKYYNPLSFLVIVSAISAYITHETGYYAALSINSTQYEMPPLQREASEIMVNNGKLLSLILIVPVRSFFTWLFFRKKGYKLAENMVLHAFLAGEINLLIIFVSVPVFLIAPHDVNINNWIMQGIMVIYLTVAFRQFFGSGVIGSFLKALLIQVLFIIFYWLLIMAFVLARHLISGSN